VTVSIYDPPPHGVTYSVLEDGIVETAETAVRQRNLNPEWKEDLSLTKFSLGSEVIIHVSDFDPSGFGSQMIGTLSFPVIDIMEAPQLNQVGFLAVYLDYAGIVLSCLPPRCNNLHQRLETTNPMHPTIKGVFLNITSQAHILGH